MRMRARARKVAQAQAGKAASSKTCDPVGTAQSVPSLWWNFLHRGRRRLYKANKVFAGSLVAEVETRFRIWKMDWNLQTGQAIKVLVA